MIRPSGIQVCESVSSDEQLALFTVDPHLVRIDPRSDFGALPGRYRAPEVFPVFEAAGVPFVSGVEFHDAPSSGSVTPELCLISETLEVDHPKGYEPVDPSRLKLLEMPCLALIDWLKASWPVAACPPALVDGETWHISPDGELQKRVMRRSRVKSSETSIGIHYHGGRLHFDGNPIKWITGQNAFGAWDMNLVFEETIYWLNMWLEGDCRPTNYDEVELKRLDLTQMVLADNPDQARYVDRNLRHVLHSRMKMNHRFNMIGETGKLYMLKWYHKGDEVRNQKRKNKTVDPTGIDSFWRFEIELRAEYLKRKGLNKISKWLKNPTLMGDVMLDLLDGIDVSLGNADPIPDKIFKNPNDRKIYRSWFAGDDIFEGYSRASKYRFRSRFMKLYDIDLFLHPATVEAGTLDGGKILSFAWARLKKQCETVASYSRGVHYKQAANY